MSSPQASSIAQALAKMSGANPGDYDSVGLESPPEQQILQNLAAVAGGYGMGAMGTGIAQALAKNAAPALEGLGEAGAIFPEGTPPESLPSVPKGAKTGDPHALYAYSDNFGPDMSKRDIYNVFGDPSSPALQQAGWGSSLPADALQKFGIPITGKQL